MQASALSYVFSAISLSSLFLLLRSTHQSRINFGLGLTKGLEDLRFSPLSQNSGDSDDEDDAIFNEDSKGVVEVDIGGALHHRHSSGEDHSS